MGVGFEFLQRAVERRVARARVVGEDVALGHGAQLLEELVQLLYCDALQVYVVRLRPLQVVVVPWQLPGALYHRPSDEHGVLDVAACTVKPKRGDRVLLVPAHCDPTVNLHDWYVGVRGLGAASPHVETVFPVAARGAVF